LNSRISDKDKKDWESFLSNKEPLPDKDNKSKKKETKKIKTIDLHGYSLDSANETIKNFIIKSFNDNTYKIIVVTGKGLHSENDKDPYVSKKLGILRYSVPEYIRNNIDLMHMINRIQVAGIEDGGDGAFYIYLKKNKKK